MGTGSRATFVLSWSQTEVDGLAAASPDVLTPGAVWRWAGSAVRIDARGALLRLEGPEGGADIRRRAARMVQRLIGLAVADPDTAILPGHGEDALDEIPDQSFAVTDGLKSWIGTLLPVPGGSGRLVMFLGETPPQGRDLWIIRTRIDLARTEPSTGGVICFATGARILTPHGPVHIEDLQEGDLVQTRDNGPQPVLWTGSRRLSGARLYALPHLRPVRFRAGALGLDRPDADLLVSPRHRMLVRGEAARLLFNSDEVLVEAEQLVDDQSITIDLTLTEVTYHHLLLENHEILFANGLEAESFHPAATALDLIEATDRARLLALMPELALDPARYGGFARRSLTASEAAILRHGIVA
ncbi:MAG: Hint domain-containing protein [Rhodobacteraceae bacterium]|jgi:hypothetical protein|nr:Hint domain-containing protein [Paracoccaceae bacterium]